MSWLQRRHGELVGRTGAGMCVHKALLACKEPLIKSTLL